MERVMRSNVTEPAKVACPICAETVVRVYLDGGRELLVSVEEELPEEELKPGLYVAVTAQGDARPVRLPTRERRNGESLHRPHELRCRHATNGAKR